MGKKSPRTGDAEEQQEKSRHRCPCAGAAINEVQNGGKRGKRKGVIGQGNENQFGVGRRGGRKNAASANVKGAGNGKGGDHWVGKTKGNKD